MVKKVAITFEKFAIFNINIIWRQVSKDDVQIIYKNKFHNDDVTNDITARRQSRPSVIMFKWNCHFFHQERIDRSSPSLTYVIYDHQITKNKTIAENDRKLREKITSRYQ